MMYSLLFLGGACLLSFAVSAVFAGKLQLRRNVYLLVYIPATGIYMARFFARTFPNVGRLLAVNWHWGLIGSVVVGAIVIRNVCSQPSYPRNRGAQFALDIVWPGLAYGVVDAVLLSVIPVLAVQTAMLDAGWVEETAKVLTTGTLGLLAGAAVTFCYHIGYPEFRNRRVLWTIFGNGVMTLAFLVTGSPLAAIIPHAAMHIAVVWHGRETAGQLPPHNQRRK
jgi:hypothetical protein